MNLVFSDGVAVIMLTEAEAKIFASCVNEALEEASDREFETRTGIAKRRAFEIQADLMRLLH